MKNFPAALQTHLEGDLITVATCWRVTRRDGRVFRFTDNVEDLVVDGEAYESEVGYNRKAIANSARSGIDNTELEGVYDDNFITQVDIDAGLFDFAKMEIFVVNYEDPTQFSPPIRAGYLGEVGSLPSGFFRVEIRGLAQRAAQRVVRKTSSLCRAELGDSLCKVPIDPPVVLRDATYSLGDFLVQPVGASSPTELAPSITNADFAALTGWTTTGGATVATSAGTLTALSGNFLTGSTSEFSASQTFNLTGLSNYSDATIDAGGTCVEFGVFQGQGSEDASGRVRVLALDVDGSEIKSIFNSRFRRFVDGTWNPVSTLSLLPVGTRQIKIVLEGARGWNGATSLVGFDSAYIRVFNSGVTGVVASHGGLVFEVTTAGTTASSAPSYPASEGASVTDGGAVMTARRAFTRQSSVSSVTDNRVFAVSTVQVDDARAVDDWFNSGVALFETGDNAGLSMEVKDWNASSGQVELFSPMPFTVATSDVLILIPGCDKRRTTCRNKFVITGSEKLATGNVANMRAEPDIPGDDAVLAYPNAT